MNVRWLAIFALLLPAALGCGGPARRNKDAYQELLDSEKRFLEDRIYDLQYEQTTLGERYESVLKENEALRKSLQDRKKSGGGAAEPGGDSPEPDPVRPSTEPDDLTPPRIEFGEPSRPGGAAPAITPPSDLGPLGPAPDALPAAPPSEDYPTSHEDLVDPRITHIHLNPLLTGGSDFDDKPGDEGLSVVVEPRNAADEYVPVAGPLSLVVLDPAKQGEAARVARWDFSVLETRELMSRSAFGQGIHLRLPWPHETPSNPKLQLFVRYTAPEGEKLEADREIFVELPGAARPWTPLAPAETPAEEMETLPAVEPEPVEPKVELHSAEAQPAQPSATRPANAARSTAGPPRSPPPGPTVSETEGRPQWKPYR